MGEADGRHSQDRVQGRWLRHRQEAQASEFTVNWRGMCAMSVVMLIPAVVFVVVVQRNLIRGLTSGAVK